MCCPRVLCLGEILFDLLADEPDQDVAQVSSWTPYPGGAPANVACGLVKLETLAAFIGCIGQDPAGDELLLLLEKIGVDITGIQRHPTAFTRKVYVTRSATGERQFAGFGKIKTTDFADTRLIAEFLNEALFINADYLVIGTLELAYPESKRAIYLALELAQRHQVKVLIDINWRPVFWLDPDSAMPIILDVLKQAEVIKCSDDEARWLFNTDNPQEILQQLGTVRGVLVTAGGQGCNYCLGNHTGHVDGFAVTVEDTTGAGDSFVAGFLHQWCLKGEEIFDSAEVAYNAVRYGCATGALTTTQPGAIDAQPTVKEVTNFLANN